MIRARILEPAGAPTVVPARLPAVGSRWEWKWLSHERNQWLTDCVSSTPATFSKRVT